MRLLREWLSRIAQFGHALEKQFDYTPFDVEEWFDFSEEYPIMNHRARSDRINASIALLGREGEEGREKDPLFQFLSLIKNYLD